MKLKKLSKNDYIIIALLGVMLLVVAIPANSHQPATSIEKNQTDYANDEEKLKATLEKIEGVGKTSVMITHDNSDQVMGVLIVTQGAGNNKVKQQICQATSALFGIEMHKIIIVKMSDQEDEK